MSITRRLAQLLLRFFGKMIMLQVELCKAVIRLDGLAKRLSTLVTDAIVVEAVREGVQEASVMSGGTLTVETRAVTSSVLELRER